MNNLNEINIRLIDNYLMTVIYIYYVKLLIVKKTTVKDVVDAECWRLYMYFQFYLFCYIVKLLNVKRILTLQTAHLQIVWFVLKDFSNETFSLFFWGNFWNCHCNYSIFHFLKMFLKMLSFASAIFIIICRCRFHVCNMYSWRYTKTVCNCFFLFFICI